MELWQDPVRWVEVILAATIPFVAISLLRQRCRSDKGIGVRAIQFLLIGTLPSFITILAIEKIIDGETVSVLIGAVIGYTLSNIKYFRNKIHDDVN